MRILLAATAAMLSLLSAVPARALDDTPTQTPYLGNKIDDNRAAASTQHLPAAPAVRRLGAAQAAAVPAPAAAPAIATAPVPLAAALPAAGRAPGLTDRVIGLR